ncbi:hypothetical protein [Bacillus weihaiensis]|uniref:hypothetical protein n=1 Tax=Bacillus weihaiensis TaxID=1547283 RepID=UPI0023575404|nr:hypothetical protein [Bacillus weihaiensis]
MVWHELKKLFTWKMVGILVLFSFLYYQLFLSFDFTYFPNGRPALDHVNVSKQMIEKYGHELDEREYQDFQHTYEMEKEKAGDYLQSKNEFVDSGVTTYEEFREMDTNKEEFAELYGKVMFEEEVDLFWELQARESILEYYENRDLIFRDELVSPQFKEKMSLGPITSILPQEVSHNYNGLITMMSVLILLSIMIIVGRIYLIDQKNHAIYLQYTTKIGRNLFKKKLLTAMISAFIIMTTYLLVFFLLYLGNDTRVFFDSHLNSFMSFYNIWFDVTFFEYILLTIIGVYVLGFIGAAISAFFSRIASLYLSLIGLQIPIAIMLILLIFEYLIFFLLGIHYPLWLPLGTYSTLILVATVLLVWRWRREKRMDLL